MTTFLISASNILHALATAIFIGHHVLLSLVYLPVYKSSAEYASLGEISRRSRPWLYASLVVFALTGFYLMIADPYYNGIGNFNNPWAVLMLVKHILILVMLGLGFWYNFIQRVGQRLRSSTASGDDLARFSRYVHIMSIAGFGVIVLTAIAQAL